MTCRRLMCGLNRDIAVCVLCQQSLGVPDTFCQPGEVSPHSRFWMWTLIFQNCLDVLGLFKKAPAQHK